MNPLRALVDILYPKVGCLACGEDLTHESLGASLCQDCANWLAEAAPVFSKQEPLCGAWSAFPYDGAALQLVRALKYERIRPAAEPLGLGMAAVSVDWRGIGALVPVPLHRRREAWRGFNQSMLLARVISEATGIPIITPLARNRHTKSQTLLDASSRETNVAGAFSCTPVRGDILLIDDVYTTGSTLRACAVELLHAGAERVFALTAAKA